MTVKEFLDQFNYSPYDDQEIAEIANEVEGKLGKTANNFLKAREAFNLALDEIGYERG